MINTGLPLTEPDAARRWSRPRPGGGPLATGTIAMLVATMAVIGLLMPQGRLPLTRGLTVVVGCFLLFGAGTIADGLLAVGRDAAGDSMA